MSADAPVASDPITPLSVGSRVAAALRRWFDTGDGQSAPGAAGRIDWVRTAPFIGMHLACLAALWVGVSATALGVAITLYVVRMFAITAFYHRYFAHRTFRTSRTLQFIFALLGASCVQRGPLWWAAHHRRHPLYADTEADPHSPRLRGFFWSHMGWFLTPEGFRTDWRRVPDFARYSELRWLDRFDVLVPVALASLLYASGALLAHLSPGLGTSGGQLLTWGFFVSTVVLFHVTVTITSCSRCSSQAHPSPAMPEPMTATRMG